MRKRGRNCLGEVVTWIIEKPQPSWPNYTSYDKNVQYIRRDNGAVGGGGILTPAIKKHLENT